LDLTLVSGSDGAYNEAAPRSQSLFQQPAISFVYERGWRQGFSWAGFPGEEQEAADALAYMSEVPPEGVCVDLSCGSGLFTRRFEASRRFGRVLGLDYSVSMLEEARQSLPATVELVRADAARLPLCTASVDAVHAGAALHCWPSPLAAFAEIARVLKPGGVFVATTFLDPVSGYLGGGLFGDAAVLPLARDGPINWSRVNSFRWWNEAEIRDLAQMAGLQSFERRRDRQYIMFAVRKPKQA